MTTLRARSLSGEENTHLANLGKTFDDRVVSTYVHGEFRSREFFERHGVPYNAHNMIGDRLIWFLPQTLWLSDGDGACLVEETLRDETLAQDWKRFAERHGINEPLVRQNVSNREKDYRACYTGRSRDVVEGYFKSDLEAFGYTFDSRAHRPSAAGARRAGIGQFRGIIPPIEFAADPEL